MTIASMLAKVDMQSLITLLILVVLPLLATLGKKLRERSGLVPSDKDIKKAAGKGSVLSSGISPPPPPVSRRGKSISSGQMSRAGQEILRELLGIQPAEPPARPPRSEPKIRQATRVLKPTATDHLQPIQRTGATSPSIERVVHSADHLTMVPPSKRTARKAQPVSTPYSESTAPTLSIRSMRFDRDDLRRAIIYNEIIGSPVALREDHLVRQTW